MLLSFMALLLSIAVMVHATDRAVHVEGRVPEVIRASQGFNPVESAGLFVGIRHFDDSEFIDVPFAVDDAVDLAHLFVLELDLIAPQQVLLALSGEPQKPQSVQALQALRQAGAKRVEAQKSKILRHLRHQAAATGKRGLFVVTFATHGFSAQGRDFLVGRDTERGFIQDTGLKVGIVFDQAAQAAPTGPARCVS